MSDHVVEIDSARFDAEVVQSPVPVVLDFYSSECPPCEALAPRFAAAAAQFAGRARFVKILRQGSRDLAVRLGVMGSPTVLFLRRGEEVGQRLCGQIRPADLQEQVEALLA